jgi:amidase
MRIISQERLIYAYSAKNPVALEVGEGESFLLETHDRFTGIKDFSNILGSDATRINAVTGAVFVKGARPGGVLRVELQKLEITQKEGVILAFPNKGAFGEKIPESRAKVVSLEKGFAVFNENIKLPLSPHVGRIGVAPATGDIPTGIPDSHGGNMDNNHFVEGTTFYLPIFHEGGLLGVGDFHALMGDGESALSGIEVAGRATLRCSIIKDFFLADPLLITSEKAMTVASAKTLDAAARKALDNMVVLLAKAHKIDYVEAAMLVSIAGDVHVCQLVNPQVTVKVIIQRSLFPLSFLR